MKKALVVMAVLSFLVLVAPLAQAAPFNWKPELHAPEWHYKAPYERHAYYNFNTDPALGGNAQYFGLFDYKFSANDTVNYLGQAKWYQNVISQPGKPGPGGTGHVGVDNRNGVSPAWGAATFHLEDYNIDWARRVWVEVTIATLGAGSEVYPIFLTSDGTTVGYDDSFPLRPTFTGSKWSYQNIWWELDPADGWEDITIVFKTMGGGYALISSFEIATEAAPEPATLALLGSSVVGLGAWMRKRRKA